jgi:hypothetical protein
MSQLVLSSDSLLASPVAGTIEYNGTAMYGTPTGTQRGLIPGMQYFRLDSNYVTSNTTSAQGVFGTGNGSGLGVTLSSNTVYEFEAVFSFSKTVSATSHTISLGFAGSATLNNIYYNGWYIYNTVAFTSGQFTSSAAGSLFQSNTASSTALTGSIASANFSLTKTYKGTVSINVGGTFIPQFTTSAAVGPYSIITGSFFKIYPIGVSGSNINVGTWA